MYTSLKISLANNYYDADGNESVCLIQDSL